MPVCSIVIKIRIIESIHICSVGIKLVIKIQAEFKRKMIQKIYYQGLILINRIPEKLNVFLFTI